MAWQLSAVLAAAVSLAGEAVRKSIELNATQDKQPAHGAQDQVGQHPGTVKLDPRWLSLSSLELGSSSRAPRVLVPALVPGAGEVFEFQNKEKYSQKDKIAKTSEETNEYEWELDEVSLPGHEKMKLGQQLATLKGTAQSQVGGHQSVHVIDESGREIFKIRRSKNVNDPRQWRNSFRILPPGSKSNDDALFTVNQDVSGKTKEEWKIYEGREREGKLLYYCIGTQKTLEFKFYRSEAEAKAGATPVATVAAFVGDYWVPDQFALTVNEGGDSALLLAVTTIIDVTHDWDTDTEVDAVLAAVEHW